MIMTSYTYNLMFGRISPETCDIITKRGKFIKTPRKKPVRKPANHN